MIKSICETKTMVLAILFVIGQHLTAQNVVATSVTLQNGLTEQHVGGTFQVSVAYEVLESDFASSASAAFYLSTDQVYDATDQFLEDTSISSSVGQYSFNFGNVLNIPQDAAIGPSYIIMFVDYTNAVNESNESDNVAFTPINILEATCNDGFLNGDEVAADCGGSCPPCAASDIRAEELTIQNGLIEQVQGGPLQVYVKYEVEDFSFFEESRVGFYFSTDQVFDECVDVFLEDIAIHQEVGFYEFGFANIMHIPANALLGQGYILMFVDNHQAVAESDETNNVVWAPINVLPGSCSDGIMNGSETGIDCGGTCEESCPEALLFGGKCCPIEIVANDHNVTVPLENLCSANVTVSGSGQCNINDMLAGVMARQICLSGKFTFASDIEILRGDAIFLDENTELHYTGGETAFTLIDAQGAIISGSGPSSIVSMDNGSIGFDVFADPNGTENNNITIKDLTLENQNASGEFGSNSDGIAIRVDNPSDYQCNTNVAGTDSTDPCNITALDRNRSAYFTRMQNLTINNFHTGIRLIDQANGTLVRNIEMNNVTRYGIYTTGTVDNAIHNIYIENCDSPDGSCSDLSAIRIDAHLLPIQNGELYCDHSDNICHLVRAGPAGYYDIYLNTIVGQGLQNELVPDDFDFSLGGCSGTEEFNLACDRYVENDAGELVATNLNWFLPWRNRVEFISTSPENEANMGAFLTGPLTNPQLHPDNFVCMYPAPPIDNNVCPQHSTVTGIESEAPTPLNLVVYPNPATQNFTIDNPGLNRVFDLDLYSPEGKVIRSLTGVSLPVLIDAADIAPGIYYAQVRGASGDTFLEKIVIAK